MNMLKELSKYKNLGTPLYFRELFNKLNKDITVQEVKEYFFNKTIDNRQIFDGCLPLLEILSIISIDKSSEIIKVNSDYKNMIDSPELIDGIIIETFFNIYKEDKDFLNFFENFTIDATYANTILIEPSVFKLKFSNIRRLFIDFNFLLNHPDGTNYFINSIYIDIFNKYIKNQIEDDNKIEQNNDEIDSEIPPKVFISYSWDNDEEHKKWVLNFAYKLAENGVKPILDRFLSPGENIDYFMEKALRDSDKVLIIFTENYNLKAMNREGGVGVEYSILNAELCKNITNNKKYVPILRNGTRETSIPLFLQQLIAIYMKDDSKFDEQFKEVLHCIFEKPLIPIPKIGKKPDYLK
ncbi:toll/interleukin-1 receptor domain-containing protein [Halarcobacter sp.]|uniref:toll/interleukin-1 receptor domain-containing protein n=1 Tax=Halarcobacter sp. TaxID=2321133 RepID=UPI003B0076FD